MLRLMTSAERRLAAISNVVRVRVEFSKNRLNTDFPRSRGTFLTSRAVTPTKEVAAQFEATGKKARQLLVGKLFSQEFLDQVESSLRTYRQEHTK